MTTEEKALAATHQCTICGALWRECDDFSWTLCSTQCGSCCDNVPMGSQIVSISEAHEADKKAFSDAVKHYLDQWRHSTPSREVFTCQFADFILPEPEPDPLAEAEDPIDALVDLLAPVLTHSQGMAARERENRFRNAMAAIMAKIERIEQ